MSSRGVNHTRGTMQAWRGMAAEGYPDDEYERTESRPGLMRRNARWRPIVRLLAARAGWTFTAGFLWTMAGGTR